VSNLDTGAKSHEPRSPLPFLGLYDDCDQPELDEDRCPACDQELADDERERPVCRRCDGRLDQELAAYLDFVAVCRETA